MGFIRKPENGTDSTGYPLYQIFVSPAVPVRRGLFFRQINTGPRFHAGWVKGGPIIAFLAYFVDLFRKSLKY